MVARYAVDQYVHSGMRLGLGAGTTLEFALHALAERMGHPSDHARRLTDITLAAASYHTESIAINLGLRVLPLSDPAISGELDLTLDGADQVNSAGQLIKGGGGALFREKILADCSRQLVIMVDESKITTCLGMGFPLPIEVAPIAISSVFRRLRSLGGTPVIRQATAKLGAVITDNGNMIVDLQFDDGIADPPALERTLAMIPGVIESGLFTSFRPTVLVTRGDSVEDLSKH